MPSIPVTILHGFLGSGKTTFLRNILQQADSSGIDLSVIVNDMSELDVDGVGTLMADAVVVFCSEAFYCETVVADVAVGEFSRVWCDFIFRLSEKSDGREIARVKTGIVFFDYDTRKIKPVPEKFKMIFED